MRAIKFKNNDYLDSSGITHHRNKLSNIIDGTLLWENSSVSENFLAQTLNVDLSKYNEIEIVYFRYPSAVTTKWRAFCKKNETTELNYSDYESGSIRTWNRQIIITNSSIIIGNNKINDFIDNKGLVPYQIIGH